MRKLIQLALLPVFLVFLTSCGGEQETKSLNATRTMEASRAAGSDHERLVQQLYLGFLGRPADPGGLAYYTQALRNANAPTTIAGLIDAYGTNETVRILMSSFADSEESRQLYPYCAWIGCDFTWVNALYGSLFSRDPDIEGAEFWARALNGKGAVRATVLLSVLAAAQGSDADLVERKIRMATQFTRTIELSGQPQVYSGQIAGAITRAMMNSSPGLADDAAIQGMVDTTVERLARLSSGAVEELAPGSRKLLLLVSGERMADNGSRLLALAYAMQNDLNQLRPDGPAWSVSVKEAAPSISGIRNQLRSYDGAILVGQLPVPASRGAPFLDVYRLPDCPHYRMSDNGEVLNGLELRPVDVRCRNGLVVSVLRGRDQYAEAAEIRSKLDQMIAYHSGSSAANASWTRRFQLIEAIWATGPEMQWGDLSSLWSGMSLFPANAISYLNAGTSIQRRDAFLACIGQNTEMCAASLHGSPQSLMFEGPGRAGEFYSSDSTDWQAWQLAPGFVKAKYVELATCSSQNFLHEDSVGTGLLMRGKALLTRGMVDVVGIFDFYEEDMIKNEYALLQNGSTFAEALYGRMEGSPDSIQGDPYITMRPVAMGARPKLLIDGKHYNAGALTIPVVMPDAVGGANSTRVLTFSNRGNADLDLRIDSGFSFVGVDDGAGQGATWESGHNAQFDTDLRQIFSDGAVLEWPAFAIDENSGAMPVKLKPGQSVAIHYKLSVRTGADGKPKRTGLYTGQLSVTSNDPGSARMYLAMQGRVR